MSYPPPHHLCHDHDLLVDTIRAYPLATLVSNGDDIVPHASRGFVLPQVTYLPLVYHPPQSGQGEYLIGHFDARNPQADSIGQAMTAVFHGPQGYISVHDYQQQVGRLPTYNYIRVEVSGATQPLPQAEVYQSLVDLATYMERSGNPWQLDPKHPLAHSLLPHIRAFRLTPERWVGRFKLSQDKPPEERRRTFDKLKALQHEPTPGYWERLWQYLKQEDSPSANCERGRS